MAVELDGDETLILWDLDKLPGSAQIGPALERAGVVTGAGVREVLSFALPPSAERRPATARRHLMALMAAPLAAILVATSLLAAAEPFTPAPATHGIAATRPPQLR